MQRFPKSSEKIAFEAVVLVIRFKNLHWTEVGILGLEPTLETVVDNYFNELGRYDRTLFTWKPADSRGAPAGGLFGGGSEVLTRPSPSG